MYKEIIERMLSYPQRGQIQIDFDMKGQTFRLTVPIFSCKKELPAKIKEYVDARKNSTFKPHTTSYDIDENKVVLVQQIPFALDFQSTLRGEIDQFWKMSRHCHKMLSEIAIEETYKDALNLPKGGALDSDLQE
jgi:hypothetical protein